jgi:hypothetical protein
MTGNLGFRVFWSLPAASLAALVVLALIRRLGIRSEAGVLATAVVGLAAAIGWNFMTSGPITAISWHAPDIKVIRDDYNVARQLAASSDPGCRILAPEHVSAWLTTIRAAPYPVFAREIYLIHYRFTMPATERALRQRLRLVVDGDTAATPPSLVELTAVGIPIGTVAVDSMAPSRDAAASFARSLGLIGPSHDGTLLVWSGRCK